MIQAHGTFYPEGEQGKPSTNSTINQLELTQENAQELGKIPLIANHPCFNLGHNMYEVYTAHNYHSSFGYHKCSRCGYEEHWQYDYESYNPMHQNQR